MADFIKRIDIIGFVHSIPIIIDPAGTPSTNKNTFLYLFI